MQWGDVTPWLLQEAVGTTRRRIPASVAYLETQNNLQLSSGMSTPPCTRTAPCSSIGAEGQHRAGTCSWGQLQSLLLVPEHLFPLYGFWERHTACDSAGRRWQGELCARRCSEGGGKRGKEGEEGDKWRGRDGGRRVGSTFCSLLPCELQPELPLVFSLTYFLRPTSPSYLMQGFSIFPALFALEELEPLWASGSCLQARLSLLPLLHPSPGILPSPC